MQTSIDSFNKALALTSTDLPKAIYYTKEAITKALEYFDKNNTNILQIGDNNYLRDLYLALALMYEKLGYEEGVKVFLRKRLLKNFAEDYHFNNSEYSKNELLETMLPYMKSRGHIESYDTTFKSYPIDLFAQRLARGDKLEKSFSNHATTDIKNTSSIQNITQKVANYFENGDYNECINLLKTCDLENDSTARETLTTVYYTMENYQLALDTLLIGDNLNIGQHAFLLILYKKLNMTEYEKEKEYLLSQKVTDSDINLKIALRLYQGCEYSIAIPFFEKYLKEHKVSFDIGFHYTIACLANKNWDKALNFATYMKEVNYHSTLTYDYLIDIANKKDIPTLSDNPLDILAPFYEKHDNLIDQILTGDQKTISANLKNNLGAVDMFIRLNIYDNKDKQKLVIALAKGKDIYSLDLVETLLLDTYINDNLKSKILLTKLTYLTLYKSLLAYIFDGTLRFVDYNPEKNAIISKAKQNSQLYNTLINAQYYILQRDKIKRNVSILNEQNYFDKLSQISLDLDNANWQFAVACFVVRDYCDNNISSFAQINKLAEPTKKFYETLKEQALQDYKQDPNKYAEIEKQILSQIK